ncbi:MAG: hydroxymethylbilane synthase [Solirubrobacteraceae bacterium]|jgi:hydroxymethylbilane synthase
MRIGTRRSALALAQAAQVGELLGDCEIVSIVTSGDRGVAGADKSRWISELEDALKSGEIDLAVHSAKDLPGDLAQGLSLLGAPGRSAVEDVLCGASGLDQLERGARVGTSSIRRAAQLRAAREDLEVVAIRGNVDTRLGRLRAGAGPGPRAIVLARAGLQRLGREAEIGAVLDPRLFVPAPGQGALAIEGRAEDTRAREAVAEITNPDTFACLLAERALARELGASCHTPLGAQAFRYHGETRPGPGRRGLCLRGWVGLPDGSAWASDEELGDAADPEALGRTLAARLLAAGAREILSRAQEMAAVA